MIFEENFMICCFNPSHHTGSDPEICFQLAAFRVSIHAPYAGSDDIPCVVLHKNREFQSTLPRRERHEKYTAVILLPSKFQSTLPRRERPTVPIDCFGTGGFNPRSHAGSDDIQELTDSYADVSIHAPTQGATYVHQRRCPIRFSFNPRSHAGSDPV